MPHGKSVNIPDGYSWVAMSSRLISHNVCRLKELDILTIKDYFNGLMICDWQDYCEYMANNKES